MTFLEEGRRFLDMTGPTYIMPLLLTCLGAVFTEAGVGDAFSNVFGAIIPANNVYIASSLTLSAWLCLPSSWATPLRPSRL